MLKLLLCLLASLTLGIVLLQLRQQAIEISHQTHQLHDQIESRQAKLWNQQLQIAAYTAPNALAQTVESGQRLCPAPIVSRATTSHDLAAAVPAN